MCVLTGIITALGTIGTAIAGSVGGSVVGGTVAGATIAGTAGATAGISAGVAVGIGAAATLATIGAATYAGVSMHQNARASAKAQQAQMDALTKLYEQQGDLEVNKTANGVKDNSRMGRTLSSLRISMLPQANSNNKEQMTQTVYGVDTNNVATSTQNMTGLNIATA